MWDETSKKPSNPMVLLKTTRATSEMACPSLNCRKSLAITEISLTLLNMLEIPLSTRSGVMSW